MGIQMHWVSFYVDPKHVSKDELLFSEDETHHLGKVRRKKKGENIWAIDGKGSAYEVQIMSIEKNRARAKIIQTRRLIGEPVTEVTLAQSLLKGERFDWLIEKATEIGIRRIIPIHCEHSETIAAPQKYARWKRVAMAAMKQSGRCILPEITIARSFHEILPLGSDCHHRLIAHATQGSTPLTISKRAGPITKPKAILLIGPEGGFTDHEIEQSQEHGFRPISLGSRRLRSETAGIVLSTLLLSQLGELG